MLHLEKNHFDLLKVPRVFALDESELERHYRGLVAAVHPDRFVNDSPEQRRLAMQATTMANEAWRCLRDPGSRATYLCELAGVAVDELMRRGASADFLAGQMAAREALDQSRLDGDRKALAALRDQARDAREQLLVGLAEQIDRLGDFNAAAASIGQLMYLDRFAEQISYALDDLS